MRLLVENCGEKKSFFFLTLFSSVVTKPRNPQNNGDTWENFINRKDKSRDLPCSSNWFFSTFLVGLLLETGKKEGEEEKGNCFALQNSRF